MNSQNKMVTMIADKRATEKSMECEKKSMGNSTGKWRKTEENGGKPRKAKIC